MSTDSTRLVRTSIRPYCQFRRFVSGAYEASWTTLDAARVASITHNLGIKPNEASILFADQRWHTGYGLYPGDRVRILADRPSPLTAIVLFDGFLTSSRVGWAGGGLKQGGWERNTMQAADYRWMVNSTSAVFGQMARSQTDYTGFGTPQQSPIANRATFFRSRRCIFNAGGKPNRDPVDLTISQYTLFPGAAQYMPLFCAENQVFADLSSAQYWTARQMLCYILSPYYNTYWTLWSIADPELITGIDHADFDTVLSGVNVEGLGVIDAVSRVLSLLGWSLRQDDSLLGPTLCLIKPGRAAAPPRSSANPAILHELCAPAVGASLTAAVAAGKKLLINGELIYDIAAVVNAPLALGAPDQYEFTAELVPGWKDADLLVDTNNLYKTEAELATEPNPDSYSFYNYYHTRGAQFRRDVGRKWVLNENGKYTGGQYDRGLPFDFATVMDDQYLMDGQTRRDLFGLFNRPLLPCLTFDKDSLNTVGIRVQFSFDGGTTWQDIPCAIENLKNEGGIRILEPNLAEILPKTPGTISTLNGAELNYWTSLCDDKQQSRTFNDTRTWKTRVRITASVQMDQRPYHQASPSAASGSPLAHRRVYDWADKYTRQTRTESSTFYNSGLPAWETDQSDTLADHLDAVRAANEDAAINGAFTLDRLWIDDADAPTFRIGDGLFKIDGRNVSLYAARYAEGEPAGVYPEIAQIIYDIERQTQTLITRDLRLSPRG